jgi:hypothetical protein
MVSDREENVYKYLQMLRLKWLTENVRELLNLLKLRLTANPS